MEIKVDFKANFGLKRPILIPKGAFKKKLHDIIFAKRPISHPTDAFKLDNGLLLSAFEIIS